MVPPWVTLRVALRSFSEGRRPTRLEDEDLVRLAFSMEPLRELDFELDSLVLSVRGVLLSGMCLGL